MVSVLDPASKEHLSHAGMAASYRTTQDALIEGLRAQVSYLQHSLEGGCEMRPLSLPDLNAISGVGSDLMQIDSQLLMERERHIATETRLQELRVGLTWLLQEIGHPGGGEGDTALLQSITKAVREMHASNVALAEEAKAARKQSAAEADKVRILEIALESKTAEVQSLVEKTKELQGLEQDIEAFKERAGAGLQTRSIKMLKRQREVKEAAAKGSWWPDSSSEDEEKAGKDNVGRRAYGNFDQRERRYKWPLGQSFAMNDGPSYDDLQRENDKLKESLQTELEQANAERERNERRREKEEEELEKEKAEARFLRAEMLQKEEAAAQKKVSQEAAVIAAAISNTDFNQALAETRALSQTLSPRSPKSLREFRESQESREFKTQPDMNIIHERYDTRSPGDSSTSPRLSPRVKEEFLRRRGHSAKGAAELVAHHRSPEASLSPRNTSSASPLMTTNFEGFNLKSPSGQPNLASSLQPQERSPARQVRSDSGGHILDELQRVQQHVRQGLRGGAKHGSEGHSPARADGHHQWSDGHSLSLDDEEDQVRKPHLVRFYRRKCMELASEVRDLSRRIDMPQTTSSPF